MPVLRAELKPGIDYELTPAAARGGWSRSDKVRFREGRVERLRGRTPLVAGEQQVIGGICRALHWWIDLAGTARFAAGTEQGLNLLVGRKIIDITPANPTPWLGSELGPVDPKLRIWSLDNFGQDLLAVPNGGGLFQWIPSNPTDPIWLQEKADETPATHVATAPQYNQGGVQTMPQRIFMLYGSSPDGGSLDPLLIRWSDQDDFTIWNPTTTNAAGSFRLSRGSRIVGALQSPLGLYIWTDLDLWVAVFEGQPNIFGFFQLGSNCGMIGQKACVVAGTTPYWMSDHGFFTASQNGPVQIPCTVWDYVYLDLDNANVWKCFAGLDYHFNEAFFFFPSASGGTGEIDSYAKFNFVDNVWDAGRLTITGWSDQNQPGPPANVGLDGIISQMDSGLDNNGQPMIGFAQSGFQDLMEGSQMIYVDRFLPDFIWEGKGPDARGPRVDITLLFRRYPGDEPTACGPMTIYPDTEYVTLAIKHPSEPGILTRPRGREWAIRIDWNALDSWTRWGAPRLMLAPDGKWQ